MKQWLMYLMCVGPPSSDEYVDQVNELSNDEEEAFSLHKANSHSLSFITPPFLPQVRLPKF
jgi:hypothetical protein